MIPAFIDKNKLPHKPGVYIFKDRSGKILYVGKAIDLITRVSSYFSGRPPLRVSSMVWQIDQVETIIVESELEALILEANLIKKYLPPFNIRLTDDKDYLYIKITKEDFPRVVIARKKDLEDSLKYFGPFPSGRTVKETLKHLRKIFPWCQMGDKKSNKTRQRPCFYYHLNLCPGSCIGKVDKSEYRKNIYRLALLLEGKKENLVTSLQQEMVLDADKQRFEEAAKIKKTIAGIEYLTQVNRTQSYLENPNFLEDEREISLLQLQKDLNLGKLPERIEGYDISNIQGENATGSMVVLTDGEVDKSQYRKFKILISGKPNDYAMHQEMMQRRLKHLEWPMPDLIIIDGGRGQVRTVKQELDKKGIKVPIYGLAKRLEWLYPPEGEIVKLSKRSLSLRLLQKLRDESHRFALSYHRKLRDKILVS
ncbi:excinuclease ABC subunit UvrC [Candidatus Daviesbacteria bacterium]|nr:excinuclease ABC subunit UvrC [Candidatus Daviesbacteria bacterium]